MSKADELLKAIKDGNKKERKGIMRVNLLLVAVILTTIFATLKLTHNIDWSWWIVFLPLIVVGALIVLILLFMLLVLGLAMKYGD